MITETITNDDANFLPQDGVQENSAPEEIIQKDEINENQMIQSVNTVDTKNSSPFGILPAFYAPKRSQKMQVPTEYNWKISENDTPYFSTVNDLGLAWDRSTHPILDWSYVQKNPQMIKNEEFDWSVADNYIKKLPSNLNYLITLNAGKLAIPPGQWEFRNAKMKSAYAFFVQKAVERYDGDGMNDMPDLKIEVKYWQIENEPVTHVDLNSKPIKPNLDYHGYAQLLKTAYEAIKTADSNATVLAGGVVSQPEPRNTEVREGFWRPLIQELNGSYVDIFDFHWFGEWNQIEAQFTQLRKLLDNHGFEEIEIWMTENGASSQTGEKQQANDLVKRLVFPLTRGVKKTFWAWGLVEGWPPFNCDSKFDYTGLIYDGHCEGDLGYGIKKLGYYSYKLLIEKLNSMDLEQIETIQESNDIYVYKFTEKATGKKTWVAWSEGGTGSLSLATLGIEHAKVTEAVPNYENGLEIVNLGGSFEKMFEEDTTSDKIELGEIPVFIEAR